MSQENVDLARRGFAAISEAYRTRDFSNLRATIREICDSDVVLKPSGLLPESGEFRGHEGMLGFVTGQAEAFDEMWIEPEDFLDAGERVVIPIRFGGRARHTGIAVEFSVTHVCTYRDRKLIRDDIYVGKAQALEAAGLSE